MANEKTNKISKVYVDENSNYVEVEFANGIRHILTSDKPDDENANSYKAEIGFQKEDDFSKWLWCGDNDREYRYCIQALDAFDERNIIYDLIDRIETNYRIAILEWKMSYNKDANYFEVIKYCDQGKEDDVPLNKDEIYYLIEAKMNDMSDQTEKGEKDFIRRHIVLLSESIYLNGTTSNTIYDDLIDELNTYTEYRALRSQ